MERTNSLTERPLTTLGLIAEGQARATDAGHYYLEHGVHPDAGHGVVKAALAPRQRGGSGTSEKVNAQALANKSGFTGPPVPAAGDSKPGFWAPIPMRPNTSQPGGS